MKGSLFERCMQMQFDHAAPPPVSGKFWQGVLSTLVFVAIFAAVIFVFVVVS